MPASNADTAEAEGAHRAQMTSRRAVGRTGCGRDDGTKTAEEECRLGRTDGREDARARVERGCSAKQLQRMRGCGVHAAFVRCRGGAEGGGVYVQCAETEVGMSNAGDSSAAGTVTGTQTQTWERALDGRERRLVEREQGAFSSQRRSGAACRAAGVRVRVYVRVNVRVNDALVRPRLHFSFS